VTPITPKGNVVPVLRSMAPGLHLRPTTNLRLLTILK